MKPHATSVLMAKYLQELVSMVGSSVKLREHKDLARLAADSADLLAVVREPTVPRSRAIRAAMRVAADGAGRAELMELLRAVRIAAAGPSDEELLSELVAKDRRAPRKKRARPARAEPPAPLSPDAQAA